MAAQSAACWHSVRVTISMPTSIARATNPIRATRQIATIGRMDPGRVAAVRVLMVTPQIVRGQGSDPGPAGQFASLAMTALADTVNDEFHSPKFGTAGLYVPVTMTATFSPNAQSVQALL